MSNKFKEIVESPPNSKYILQGNAAFALGVVHAGYHAADGYPGTPSTEVIDKSLAHVQDKIKVGWSVNEAVAVNLAVGRVMAGLDTVVTMKIPGVFQAGDAISTAAFYNGTAGALVIFAATDYVPSSTQHVIDARHFFSSARIPVLEPRDHQEMYEIAWDAADISREFNTPVVVLASGILTHSEGLVVTREPRTVTPREVPSNLHPWMLMPGIARDLYDKATTVRIPSVRKSFKSSHLVEEIPGSTEWGIIVSGEATIILREALDSVKLDSPPSILSLAATYPVPEEKIKDFAAKVDKLFIVEDGEKFLQDRIRLLGIEITGKDEPGTEVITNWTPEQVLQFLSQHRDIQYHKIDKEPVANPVPRPPSICPGCPYRAFALSVAKLRKKKKLYAAFGDIGCSTLLFFLNSLDTVGCMGSSDSMRQGFVLSRPEMAKRTISVIGDSCECHSGLDSTRNAVFRNVAGVKVLLDNRITAMTGGQPAPSSDKNLEGQAHKFNLRKAVSAEVERTVVVDSYDLPQVEKVLSEALDWAEQGEFTVLILQGACIQEVSNKEKTRKLEFDYEKCKRCGLCNICPGIEIDDEKKPHFTLLCTNCGGSTQVCQQRCPFDAIVPKSEEKTDVPGKKKEIVQPAALEKVVASDLDESQLPGAIRLAIRGIGGQGNLFFGRVLSEVAMRTPYANRHIVKGDTHGMAQLGGPVISTFSCGDVFSPILAPGSADLLVAMEVSEVLRPGFLELLVPGGTIIINRFTALPVTASKEDYPAAEAIDEALEGYSVIKINAAQIATGLGDQSGRTANVAVLGLLSTLHPFHLIPQGIWEEALSHLSPNEFLATANIRAFRAGRDHSQ